MGYVGLFKTKAHWADESLVFWWFTSKVFSYESDFVDSSLPAFSLSLTRSNNLKHFSLSHRLNFLNRHGPLTGLLFSLLLDHVGKDFWVLLLLSVHEIGRYSTLLYIFNSALGVLFFMLLDGFFHLDFLLESFLVEDFGFESSQGLCLFGDDFCLSGIFLSTLLFSI